MKKATICGIWLVCVLGFMAVAQSVQDYSRNWKNIEQFEKESLPASVVKETEQIMAKAAKEQNMPVLLKAWMYKAKSRIAISPDSAKSVFAEGESLLNRYKKDVAFAAMLHSVLGDMYGDYYRSRRSDIGKRTPLVQENNPDIDLWSIDMFKETEKNHVMQSLENREALSLIPADRYGILLEKGVDSPRFRQSLFSFLAFRAIGLLSMESDKGRTSLIIAIYDDLKAVNSAQNNREALLMSELARIDFQSSRANNAADTEAAFLALQKSFRNLPLSVEIDYNLARFYIDNENPDYEKALAVCREALALYPTYERIGIIEQLMAQIKYPHLSLRGPHQFYPGEKGRITLSYKNMQKVALRFYSLNNPLNGNLNIPALQLKNKTLVTGQTVDLGKKAPYLESDTTITIPAFQPGDYMLEAEGASDEAKGDTVRMLFVVSRLASVSRSANGKLSLFVADFKTGQPVPGARIIWLKYASDKYTETGTTMVNKDGLTECESDRNNASYRIVAGKDTYSPIGTLPYVGRIYTPQREMTREELYTDRVIYRPGQEVFFKLIAYRSSLDRGEEVMENKPVKVILYEMMNNKVLEEKRLVTNAFGSAAGSFTLPHNLLNGEYALRTEGNGAFLSFTVSEYKLPSFRIDLSGEEKSYQFGDKVMVNGVAETFSGLKLTGREVRYSVIRQSHWLFRSFHSSQKIVASGRTTTNDKGAFVISFVPQKEESRSRISPYTAYSYQVKVEITDATGETHEESYRIAVGDVSMVLKSGLPDKVDREHLPELIIKAENLNGKPVVARGTYKLYRYKDQSLAELDNQEKAVREEKPALSGEFETGKAVNIDKWSPLVSGDYLLVLESKDDQGRTVVEENRFTLFHFYEKQPPVTTYLWRYDATTECRVGEPAVILFGSSADIRVLFEVYDDKMLVDRKWLNINNNVRRVVVPFLSQYGKSISIVFSFFCNGKYYSETVQATQKDQERKISYRWDTFRSKLIPGQKEEWKLTLLDHTNYPLKAELMAQMYDLSLDRIKKFTPQFDFHTLKTAPVSPWVSRGESFSDAYGYQNFRQKEITLREFQFDRIALQIGFQSYHPEYYVRGVKTKSAVLGSIALDDVSSPVLRETVVAYGVQKNETPPSNPESGSKPFPLRENFTETAFFFPQLQSDREGKISMRFTLPENLTEWQFVGRAHTKDLRHILIQERVVARKELMIEPFLPRFVRRGDTVVITARVSNLTEKPVAGRARVEFFSLFSGKSLAGDKQPERSFTAAANSSTTVSWLFHVPDGEDVTGCRFVAETPQFSDGEERALPVLSDKQLVTEATPVYLNTHEQKIVQLPVLSKGQTPYRTSVELVANPAWYAVQALPVVAQPESKDLVSWLTSYYVHTVSAHIARTQPAVSRYLKMSSQTNTVAEQSKSPLDKNGALKSVLLDQTPWVSEARSETDRINRLSQLLDVQKSESFAQNAYRKLRELQLPSGGFAWFAGMRESEWLTRFVLMQLARLQAMRVVQPDNQTEMIQKAVHYLDNQTAEAFASLKKNRANWQSLESLSFEQLQTLYTRSFYKQIPVANGAVEAYRFYETVAERQWPNAALHEKALTMQWMLNRNSIQMANKVLSSIKEFAVTQPESGLFFPSLKADYRFGRTSLGTHTAILEAMDNIGTEQRAVEQMKLWLLKQKQTRQWSTLPETIDAIYALLRRGDNLLAEKPEVTVKAGDKLLFKSETSSPVFEYKVDVQLAELTASGRKIAFNKTTAGMAWGAVYNQYFQKMDDIKEANSGLLSVQKTLFVEQTENNQRRLAPVTDAFPLTVGQKVVVRLVIKNSQALDFVHLKDLRSACLEPVEQISAFKAGESFYYYQETKDASTQFFIEHLPKGTFVLEYPAWVTREGRYSSGPATIQCLYAPQFVAHSSGGRIVVTTR